MPAKRKRRHYGATIPKELTIKAILHYAKKRGVVNPVLYWEADKWLLAGKWSTKRNDSPTVWIVADELNLAVGAAWTEFIGKVGSPNAYEIAYQEIDDPVDAPQHSPEWAKRRDAHGPTPL